MYSFKLINLFGVMVLSIQNPGVFLRVGDSKDWYFSSKNLGKEQIFILLYAKNPHSTQLELLEWFGIKYFPKNRKENFHKKPS